MDYLSLLKTKKAEKTALIAKGVSFTYGDLVREAAAIRNRAWAGIKVERKVRFISQEKIRCQLLEFLAFSGTEEVPVIATAASAGEVFDGIRIPPATCMGVMTSGSTGKSKLLWRSYGSWADFFRVPELCFRHYRGYSHFLPGKPRVYGKSQHLHWRFCSRRYGHCRRKIPPASLTGGKGKI
ncbi:MAG: hypothetical protein LUF25_00675 [Phascolarctobacterium sp.]|nr:hypothetical protein [Phascolarctobacterium sp.]